MSYGNLEEYDRNILSYLNNRSDIDLKYYASKNISDGSLECYTRNYSYHSKRLLLSRVVSYLKSQINLLYDALTNSTDVVHFEWFKIPLYDIVIIVFLKLAGIKVTFKAHNIFPHDSSIITKLQYVVLYRLMNHVFVHNDITAKSLERYSSRISTVPHGLLCGGSLLLATANRKDKLVVGHLGVLSKYKGTDTLLKYLLARAKSDTLKPYSFICAGKISGIELPDLNSVDNVEVRVGYMSNEEFISTLTKCDLLLLPYTQISDSGVVKTAITHGIPVALSEIDSFKEAYIDNGLALSLGNCSWEELDSFFKNLDKSKLENIKDRYHEYRHEDNSWLIHSNGLINIWKDHI